MGRKNKMGDTKRFRLLADFIQRNYPHKKTILDVAGGKDNYLAQELRKNGYEVKSIDPKSKDIRDLFTLELLRELEESERFDLIVGLHPDGATKDICKAASTHDIVIVPCCNMWTTKEQDIYSLIENYLRSNKIPYSTTILPMKGKNFVFYSKNHRVKRDKVGGRK